MDNISNFNNFNKKKLVSFKFLILNYIFVHFETQDASKKLNDSGLGPSAEMRAPKTKKRAPKLVISIFLNLFSLSLLT